MNKKLFLILLLAAISQLVMAGDWKTRYIKDAFGDSDYSQPIYTVDLNGTTNVVRDGEKCVLGLMVKPSPEFPVYRAFLVRNGDDQSFFSETHIFVKLANGKKYELSCDPEDSNLWIGATPQECNAILDMLNQGNFTLVIKSTSMFGDNMTCTFHVGNQTTGIKNLVNK